MIDFACKQFVVDDIVKCSLGLAKADLRVLKHLATVRERLSTDAISSDLRLDLSTVQRAVKKLHEQEVVIRFQENLSGGGYVFYY
jgi:predicted transcriptional regulator